MSSRKDLPTGKWLMALSAGFLLASFLLVTVRTSDGLWWQLAAVAGVVLGLGSAWIHWRGPRHDTKHRRSGAALPSLDPHGWAEPSSHVKVTTGEDVRAESPGGT